MTFYGYGDWVPERRHRVEGYMGSFAKSGAPDAVFFPETAQALLPPPRFGRENEESVLWLPFGGPWVIDGGIPMVGKRALRASVP